MPVRRAADPISVQHVWDAIRYANSQRQMADFLRIVKYLQKVDNCSQTQAELYLQQTLDDGLVVSVNKVSVKGQLAGSPVESYRIPTQELEVPKDDGKDWYCIECHLAGDVSPCTFCFRVFHAECSKKARQKLDVFKCRPEKKQSEEVIKVDEEKKDEEKEIVEEQPKEQPESNMTESKEADVLHNDVPEEKINGTTEEVKPSEPLSKFSFIYDESLCSLCNLNKYDIECDLSREELNHLLGFLLIRIRSWLPENITNTMAPDTTPDWMTELERSWRARQLFYQHMDMAVIELKLKAKEYTKLCEFYADVITIRHNIAVFHGIESQEYGAAELMLRDCVHDINELRNCVDCYKHSNEKINSKWFCLPCRVPHKLVWAKQKGYPYWPAKVITETDTSYDVRFFGGKYERSVLPKNCIKPITTSMSSLQIKKSSAFNKAHQELLLHQKVLADPVELNKLSSYKVKRRETKRSHSLPDNDRMPKITQKRPKSVGARDDVFEFSDSLSELDSSYVLEKPYLKRKIEANETGNTKKGKFSSSPGQKSNKSSNRSSDVINISDVEEESEGEGFSGEDEYQFRLGYDNENEQVTSSTEYFRTDDNFKENSENSMQQLDQPYCDAVEKMRRKLETSRDKKELIKIAMDCMQGEIDKITNEHNEHLKKLFESHNAQISETKKKQWCYNCEQDAIYHCCWNTAYCSTTCQQQHWQSEHKKVCRRKR